MKEIDWRRFAVIAVMAVLLWLTRDLLKYLLIMLAGSVLIAMLISPLQKRFESRLPRMASIIAAWLMVFAVAGIAVVLLVPLAARQAAALCEAWPKFCSYAEQYISLPDAAQWSVDEMSDMLSRLTEVFAHVGSGIGVIAGGFSRFGMMWIASIFLLREKERYLLMAELLILGKYRKAALRIGRRMQRELRLFICGQATVALCVGALNAIGLMLIGIRSGLLLGVISGLFNLIPYFGPIFAAVPTVLVAWMDGWVRAAAAGAVLIAVQQIDGCFLSPKIMSSATGLSPLVVLLSISVGGFAFGVPGMLLAIPSAIIGRILFTELVQNRLKYYG